MRQNDTPDDVLILLIRFEATFLLQSQDRTNTSHIFSPLHSEVVRSFTTLDKQELHLW